ncbi:uncharacterized protein PV09_02076 [Verruconis gallopava]|uniref:ML-like domain-containing protein n=1 Tax=Verruconis gallopava TaxID=253628 RepID=A0A0D1XWN8_9PEZI|nr:uncharacterized protein PV09_02076 [Verruconis gallopava]KIW07211.1 hypothetical protein PV09_02076 [Verruconis gallopava]
MAFVGILGFLQTITIVLISDLDLKTLPARSSVVTTPYSLKWTYTNNSKQPEIDIIDRSTTWLRKPQMYPTVAEYSQPRYIEDGVEDTGISLRAFLPLTAASDRETLHEYIGRTTVVDTRVTCQVPDLLNAMVQASSTLLTLNGTVRATTKTPRLGNFTAVISNVQDSNGQIPYEYNVPVPFSCTAGSDGEGDTITKAAGQWRVSLCQLGETSSVASGGLVSEFRDPARLPKTRQSRTILGIGSEQLGTGYLLLNVTLGGAAKWEAVTGNGATAPAISQHGPWRDLVYSNADLVLSVSLCYSGFDAADLPVQINSKSNRSEPFPTYDRQSGTFKFESRNTWLAEDDELSPMEPYIRRFVNMYTEKVAAIGIGNAPNITTILWQSAECLTLTSQRICPDPMYMWLFQDIVKTGGSVAFALQSLLTLLSSLAYYDQLGQFDKIDQARQTFFATTNTPQDYTGFIAVAAVVIIHTVLITAVLYVFLAQTECSMLGNTWQAVGQLVSTNTVDFFDIATIRKDSQVQQYLRRVGTYRTRVGIGERQTDGHVGLLKS